MKDSVTSWPPKSHLSLTGQGKTVTKHREGCVHRDYLTDIGHFGPIVTGLKGSVGLHTSKPNKT